MLENKYLRWHYVVAAILFTLLIVGFLVFKNQHKINYNPTTLELLKTFSYLITFTGIPFAYGWFRTFFTTKVEPEEEMNDENFDNEVLNAIWKKRFFIFSFLMLFNAVLFVTTFDRSLLFLLIISVSVYLLNKPHIANNK